MHRRVTHNGRRLNLSGYRSMLEDDIRAIPDLRFTVADFATAPDLIAARLWFDCTPQGRLFDLPVNGRRVQFAEHVFYRLRDARIHAVQSLIDVAAIAAQLDA